MDNLELEKWLSEPRSSLIAAVADCVRAHVSSLEARGMDFYGYALLPGEPYDLGQIVVVTNSEADIKVPRTDDRYLPYRFSPDEWANWETDAFEPANALLMEANEHFGSLHEENEDDFEMDEFEIAHSNALLDAMVRGLEVAKAAGVFGDRERFLALWISDSDHPILMDSVRRLNTEQIAAEFREIFE